MIDFPVVDPHLHVWDLKRFRYPWLDKCPRINRTYLLEDFDRARGDIDVDLLVFVQCECLPEQSMKELAWVASLADADPRIRGIVPWAPLEYGDGVGERVRKMAGDDRVKGVRRILQFEHDDAFCLQSDFVRGVQLLGETGLHFELTLSPRQLPNACELAERCPQTRFVLDHIGNPDIAGGKLQPWADDLKRLARCNRVWCKVSGLATNADLDRWQREDFLPYLETVFEAFGPDRVMFAGDWPHALRATPYRRWFETLDWATRHQSAPRRRKLFRENAIRFYRLPVDRHG